MKKREWTIIADILGLKMRTGGYGPLVRGTNGKRLDLLGDYFTTDHNELFRHSKKHEELEILHEELPETSA